MIIDILFIIGAVVLIIWGFILAEQNYWFGMVWHFAWIVLTSTLLLQSMVLGNYITAAIQFIVMPMYIYGLFACFIRMLYWNFAKPLADKMEENIDNEGNQETKEEK